MSTDNEVFQTFQKEFGMFQANGSMIPALTATQELILQLKSMEKQLQSDSETKAEGLDQELVDQVDKWKGTVANTQKKSATHLTRMIKLVDNKVYEFDVASELQSLNSKVMTGLKLNTKNKNLINQVVLNHLVRESGRCDGMVSTREADVEESDKLVGMLEKQFGYSVSESLKEKLRELRWIIDSIVLDDIPNLAPAFEWCAKHVTELTEIGSDLEFKLHELKFLLLFNGIKAPGESGVKDMEEGNHYVNDSADNSKFDAYLYARSHFGQFLRNYSRDPTKLNLASKLLTSTVIGSSSDTNVHPYANLLTKNLVNYRSTVSQLIDAFFQVNQLRPDSNLHMVLLSSYVALPSIIKLNTINKKLRRASTLMKSDRRLSEGIVRSFSLPSTSRRVSRTSVGEMEVANEFSPSKDELPLDVDLPEMLQNKHTIFICPISRQETTKKNPPVLLPCKHLISKESLHNLVESRRGLKRRRGSFRNWSTTNDFQFDNDNAIEDDESDHENEVANTEDTVNQEFSANDSDEDTLEEEEQEEGFATAARSSESVNERSFGGSYYSPQLYIGRRDPSERPFSQMVRRPPIPMSMDLALELAGNNISFKCPYCPHICKKSESRVVRFYNC